jgi:hypothetical protein
VRRYGTKGRTLADGAALHRLWSESAVVREAFNDALSKFESHAFAENATQDTPENQALTLLIWNEMRERGYEVSLSPHFAVPKRAPAEGSLASTV